MGTFPIRQSALWADISFKPSVSRITAMRAYPLFLFIGHNVPSLLSRSNEEFPKFHPEMISLRKPVSNSEMRIFLYTLCMLSPTSAGGVPLWPISMKSSNRAVATCWSPQKQMCRSTPRLAKKIISAWTPSYSEYSNCHALSCFWRSGKSLPEPLIEPAGNALLTVPEMSVFHENTKG